MVLKQRFANGRTQFIDIGSDFVIQTPASAEWASNGKIPDKDVHAIIQYDSIGGVKEEALYIDFLQWIYSNDGQIFVDLNPGWAFKQAEAKAAAAEKA